METPFPPFSPCEPEPWWKGAYSIPLGELVEAGFDPFGDPRWAGLDWYDDETRERIQVKITARFKYREIGLTPPGVWRDELTRVMGEILPKYKALYAALASDPDILATSDEYGKDREVFSAFPATQLNPEREDYARNARDTQFEHVSQGDFTDQYTKYASRYNDVDVLVLDDLEVCFSCLITVAVNGL